MCSHILSVSPYAAASLLRANPPNAGEKESEMSCANGECSSCRWWQPPCVYEPGHCEAPRLHSKCKNAKYTGMLSLTHTRELAVAPIGYPVAGTREFY